MSTACSRAHHARRGTRRWLAVIASVCVFTGSASAQQGALRGTIVGRVTNALGEPLENARIELVGAYWQATSARSGTFKLVLPAGEWSLLVRRIGYAPARTSVVIGPTGAAADTVRIALSDAPNDLTGVVVTGDRSAPFVSTMTTETVRQAPALGEADILRLLPMLPAVAQPNDVIGRLHFGGGASDEHGISLDGHPLQSPYHVHSVLGAFNVAALDRADVSIHHLPSAREGRLSGAIDLESRHASVTPSREAVVSLLSSSLTITQPSTIAGLDVLASGRITYLDQLLRTYVRRSGQTGDDLMLPAYRDGLLKIGRAWESGWTVEALGYGSLDHWTESTRDSTNQPLRWGEALGGLRAGYRGARWHASARLSSDRAFAGFRKPYDIAPGTAAFTTV